MFHTPAHKNTTTSPAGQLINHRPVVNLEMPLVRAIEQFKALAQVPAQAAPVTIDLTPLWTALVPVFLAILQDGTQEGKKMAATELRRMAKAADLYNAVVRTTAH